MDWWDIALGAATGGLYTAGRAGVDLLFNGGKGTAATVNEITGAVGNAANAAGDWLGMNPNPVAPGSIDPNAAKFHGYEDWRDSLAAGRMGASARATPQLDTGPQSQVRADQAKLTQMLQDQAMGNGPSIAQQQLQQATDRNVAQAMALGQSQRGGAQGGALRNIATNQAQIGQQMAGDSAMLRLQEMMQARGMLGQHLGGMRGQDIGFATNQAQAGLQGLGLNDQMVQFYTQQGLGLDKTQMEANLKMQEMLANDALQREKIRQQNLLTAQGNRMGLVNTFGNISMTAAGA